MSVEMSKERKGEVKQVIGEGEKVKDRWQSDGVEARMLPGYHVVNLPKVLRGCSWELRPGLVQVSIPGPLWFRL